MNDELIHYGVLGMKWGVRRTPAQLGHLTKKDNKWGVRKERLSLKTKSGDTITLSEHPSSKLASFLAKYSKRAAAEQEKTAVFNIKDPDGNTVGDITLYKEASDSINVVWVTTNESVRGRGYGTAVMKAAIQVAKDTGSKQVTLEVPGSSPDAKHIYEKLGFKEVASPNKDVNDIWGGLTNMRLDLNEIKHSLSPGGLVKVSMAISKGYMSYLVNEIDNLDFADEITHHGVLGMKWGRRKPKNTSAPKKGKSKRQLKLEDKYQKQGLTKAQSETAARKRIKTEKILAVTAGVTIAALGAYAGYRYYDNTVDKFIKSGKMLQNINTFGDRGVSDAFYASMNKKDNTKYAGFYAYQLRDKNNPFSTPKTVFKTDIQVDKTLKLASRKNSTKAVEELLKNDMGFKKAVGDQLLMYAKYGTNPKQKNIMKKAFENIKKGKIDADVYDAINITLADRAPTGMRLRSKLFNQLKNKGYDAIVDVNDKHFSGYRSKNPLIVFNGASKTKVKTFRELNDEEIYKNYKRGEVRMLSEDLIKKAALWTSGMGVFTLGNIAYTEKLKAQRTNVEKINRKKRNRIV